jgi:hypothetical protein
VQHIQAPTQFCREIAIVGQTITNSKNLEKPLDVPIKLQYHILNFPLRREEYVRTIWDNTKTRGLILLDFVVCMPYGQQSNYKIIK